VTRRFLSICLCAIVLAIAAAPVRAQTAQEAVKATFVYRFASFVSWPQDAFADPNAPVRLCVIGAAPFARSLQQAVSGQHVGARSFQVTQLAGAAQLNACQVAYVVGERTEATLQQARGHSVLTITDGGGERGMIHFALVDDRVRFYIDDARAAESRIAIDPRLLSLAISVRRRTGS